MVKVRIMCENEEGPVRYFAAEDIPSGSCWVGFEGGGIDGVCCEAGVENLESLGNTFKYNEKVSRYFEDTLSILVSFLPADCGAENWVSDDKPAFLDHPQVA